ncbi:VOC family protein [Adhaeribacter radiodurans]|uniref:VOC family protein n=1 Tax=Adhaeribacter radiodurans TaxID=2745197 RepID=A0A7L7L3L4_9BACT|nr:VOC family protein [Adhaeribacter radiodurans]QMU27411.1 VOC family protein [Adhaeribacter radiodurans]
MNIPNGHQSVMPYLMLNGAASFINFVQQVFDAKLTMERKRNDHQIRHAEVQINTSTIMFCDATEEWKAQNANLFVYVPNADETYEKAINAGAETIMPLSDQDYGRTCGITDPTGNVWWITSIH